jgi:hypothetical protein
MSDPQSCGQCECCEAWRQDRDRLTRERDAAREALVSLTRHHQLTVTDLEIDRARAATLLRQVEWILPPDVCPICYGAKPDGHAFECALQVALGDLSDDAAALEGRDE